MLKTSSKIKSLSKKWKGYFKKRPNRARFTFVLIIAFVGTGLLLISNASGFSVALEAENGTKSNVATVSDSTASAGQAVQFGSGGTGTGALNLPKEAWYGGNNYWAKFADAKAAGWDQNTFYPIAIWWDSWDTQAQVQYDKDQGINTYVIGNNTQDMCILKAVGGMYWASGPIKNSSTCGQNNWPATFLDDEQERCDSGQAGARSYLGGLRDAARKDYPGKAIFNNYGDQIVQLWYDDSCGEGFVNDFQDATSFDRYLASDLNACKASNSGGWWPYASIVPQPSSSSYCRLGQSYGRLVEGIKARDAADGKLTPVSAFIEDLNALNGSTGTKISPERLKAAVVSELIHGAGYIIYFNNSDYSACSAGNVIRAAQNGATCAQANITALREVNTFIKNNAPIINSQPYQWDFGCSCDTSLRAYNGYGYILAETSGGTGSMTFTLPPQLAANASVADETGRTVSVNGGKFTDTFETPDEFHLYKVRIN